MKFICRDLIVQVTGATRASVEVFQALPPVRERYRLAEGIWIGRIDEDINTVFNACEPTGLNFNPAPPYGYRYCFVREFESDTFPSVTWDEDRKLQTAVMLSRLIHPTTASNGHSARLIYKDGSLWQIIPGQTGGFGTDAWVPRGDWRNWLTREEAAEVKALLANYEPSRLPSRLNRALRHFQSAQMNPYLDQRIASVVTALEAALKTHKNSVSKQFKERVSKLGEYVNVSVSPAEAAEFYDDRSDFVHGTGIDWATREDKAAHLYEKLEMLLRKTLAKAISDSSFARVFETAETVRERFPVCNCF